MNESLRVADLELPEGVKAMEEPETVVASVTVVAEEEVPVPEEVEAAEPELIGEKGEEEPKPAGEEKTE